MSSEETSELLKGGLLTLATQVASFALNALTLLIIARGLGPSEQGTYSLLILLPMMLIQIGSPGIGVANVYLSGRHREKLGSIAANSFVSAVVLGGILALIGLAVPRVSAYIGMTALTGVNARILTLLALAVPLSMLSEYWGSMLRGLERFRQYNLVQFSRALGQAAGAVMLLCVARMALAGAVLAYTTGVLASALLALLLLRASVGSQRLTPDWGMLQTTLRYGWKAYFWNLALFLDRRLDLFVLGFLVDTVAIGYYSVSVGIVEKLWYLPNAFATVLLPHIAADSSHGERLTYGITASVSRGLTFLLGGVSFVLIIFAVPLIRLTLGPGYLPAVSALRILLASVAMSGLLRVLTADLAGRGQPEVGAWVSLIVVGVNLPLDLVLVPRWGISGAALASLTAYTSAGAAMLCFFRRASNLPIHRLLIMRSSDWRRWGELLDAIYLKVRMAVGHPAE